MAPECWREDEMLSALREAPDFEELSGPVREHLASCESCAALAELLFALREERRRLEGFAPVPDPALVWRRMQRKAWEEAAMAAGRPITAVQVLAFAGAAGVAGACYGATSEWFQNLFGRAAAWLWAGVRAAPRALETAPWVWIAVAGFVAAAFLLAPLVIWFLLSSEKA